MAGFEHYAWLMKSEPSEVSVDDVLQMDGCKVGWFGVRNYQARNFMRDLCKIGIRFFSIILPALSPGSSALVR